MFSDPPDFFQAPNASNTSETRLERLKQLSELAQSVLMSSAIEIIVAKATVTPSDPLERLATMSRQALPVDRLRIERTIRPRLNSRVTRGHLELSPRKRLLSVGCSYRWMAHVGGMNSTAMSPAAKPVS